MLRSSSISGGRARGGCGCSRSLSDLEHHLQLWRTDRRPGLVLLMEGADPIVRVDDLGAWWRRGVRIVGLTFGDTRYGAGVAGGGPSGRSGGLTDDGVALLSRMAELGLAWDVSHLTEQGIWQGLETGFPRVCASHASSIRVTVDVNVRRHVTHIAEIAGWAHVGIGSDLDGGFGREESPEEIDTIADLHTVGSVVAAEIRDALLGENWLTFLRCALP